MKSIVQFSRRVGPLLRLATEYTAAHIATRALAAISGLLLVRLLPVSEYGFYTLVLTAFTFICTFSDLGATETLSFFRRRSFIKNRPWMQYFYAVMQFRKKVFIFGIIVSAVYVFYTAKKINRETSEILIAISLVGIAAWFSIQSGIISYVLKLEQRFRSAYLLEIGNESVKLFVVGCIWMLGVATALAGMTGVALGALVATALAGSLWKPTWTKLEDTQAKQRKQATRILLKQVVPTLPGSIHFALQGVLVAWLAANFGSVVNVAEVGALGRLGVLISVIAGFTGNVFVPRLLVITDESLFLRRYLLWWSVICLLGFVIMMFVWIYPDELLFLLGKSYSGLHSELLVVTATAVVGAWGGFAWNISRSRGWIKYHSYSVPVTIICQIAMFYVLDFSSTQDVLLFGLGTLSIGFLYQLITNTFGLYNSYYRSKITK